MLGTNPPETQAISEPVTPPEPYPIDVNGFEWSLTIVPRAEQDCFFKLRVRVGKYWRHVTLTRADAERQVNRLLLTLERLAELGVHNAMPNLVGCLREARAEVERLRAELAEAREMAGEMRAAQRTSKRGVKPKAPGRLGRAAAGRPLVKLRGEMAVDLKARARAEVIAERKAERERHRQEREQRA